MRKNTKLTEEYNKAGFEFAYIMDETDEERQRGVTIEVTTKFFSTEHRTFTILDAPGHRDFIANMITGAAQANSAILVIDSMPTQFERGWNGFQGTSMEHAALARSLGCNQMIVAINKLEKVLWNQERYDYIVDLLYPYLISVGFKKDDIQFVPISGLEGHNLITRHDDPNLTKWYKGECLI